MSNPQTQPAKVSVRSILGERSVRVIMLITFVIMLGFGIIAPILPDNAPSQRVAERLGMRHEGQALRHEHLHDLWVLER